ASSKVVTSTATTRRVWESILTRRWPRSIHCAISVRAMTGQPVVEWTGRSSSPDIVITEHVPQNPFPSGFRQLEFPHADDRGSVASADHAGGRERVWEIDPPAFDLLCAARGGNRRVCVPPRSRQGGIQKGLSV